MIAGHEKLIRRLTDSGVLSAGWRSAFVAVPRHLFIPPVIWDDSAEDTGGDMVPVSREKQPDRWLSLVYADDAVVTQVEDGRDLAGDAPWLKSSSSSAPSVMATMLDQLDVAIHHRVLELGTGTGWNAALLAARLGDEQVTSIEVDPRVADQARKALADAGYTPTVITGDGALGNSAGAPYDRIIATAAVQRVPYPWVAQTRAGGRIVTPWGTPYDNSGLLNLQVNKDRTASGNFARPWVGFMWLRAQRAVEQSVEDVVDPRHDYTEKVSPLHPWEPVGTADGRFAVSLQVPDCTVTVVAHEDGQDNHFVAYLVDATGGSWASAHVEPDMVDEVPVRQYGPRRLWDEVEAAHRWWVVAGKPDHTRFGVKVQPGGRQWVWLDTPERLVGM